MDWHKDDRAKPIVRQYQIAVNSVLRSHPQLQPCLVTCVHCEIEFLTHPRCAGRRDLRCPFGCRQHHRRQRSTQRSAAYYQTPIGKRLKKQLNNRRSHGKTESVETETTPQVGTPPGSAGNDDPRASPAGKLQLAGAVVSESSLRTSSMLSYVRMVVALVDGVQLSCHELVQILLRSLRQHSIAYRTRMDYVLLFLHQHPP